MGNIKENIFDHILYEFEMYLYSFCKMCQVASCEEIDQLEYNIALESHSVHLRNLLEFFNCKPEDCINVNSILSGTHNYVLSEGSYDSLGVKQYVNKSVDHLTVERYKWETSPDKNLAERQKKIPGEMYCNYIPVRIKGFLKQLNSREDVKSEWTGDLYDALIQTRINYLITILESFPDVMY